MILRKYATFSSISFKFCFKNLLDIQDSESCKDDPEERVASLQW